MAKQPLSDEQRQQFLNKLFEDGINLSAERTFSDAVASAAQPK